MLVGMDLRRLALVSIVLLASPPAHADAPLALASDRWPPFVDERGGDRRALELVEEALGRIGVASETEIRDDLLGLIDDVRAGRIDGSAALWKSDAREAVMHFSAPYLENRLVLLGRRGQGAGSRLLPELHGQTVGVVTGYAYGDEVDRYAAGMREAGARGPTLVPGANLQENLDRLLRGEIDLMLADELIVHEIFERHGDRAELLLEVGDVAVQTRSLHLALRRDLTGAASILERFDAAIRDMIRDGTFNRILRIRWLRADVDLDGAEEWVLGGGRAGTEAASSGYRLFGTGASTDAPDAAPPSFVVEGRAYEHWQQIPEDYRQPVERDAVVDGPGIVVLEF